jgi:ABC-type uncharacterized transport system permease subunit
VVGYFLRYSRTGRALYTAGGNATAAYYTGINAGKMQFVSFACPARWRVLWLFVDFPLRRGVCRCG